MNSLWYKLQFITLIVLIAGCTHAQSISSETKSAILIDQFIDSTQVGSKGFSKVEVLKLEEGDSSYIEVNCYTKKQNNWQRVNNLKFNIDPSLVLDVEIADFNNDGFNDFTYKSELAGNGSNEIRKLFIFEPDSHKFVYIKNSENYPNLSYNSKLNCLTAFFVYGGSSTLFLKLEGDKLTEFAAVHLSKDENGFTKKSIVEINKSGKETLLNESLSDDLDVHTRYTNYKPLED